MFSHYQKLIFAPITIYGLEDGGHQVIEDTRTDLQKLEDHVNELSADGVDNSDIQLVLSRLAEDRDSITAEIREGEKEIVVSMLEDLGAQIAQGNLDGVFQAKWASGRLVFDSYAGFGGDETQALSRNSVSGLIDKLGMTRDDVIAALGVGNEDFADMLVAGLTQRGPNPEQVEEILAQANLTDRINQEDIVMSQPLVAQEKPSDIAQDNIAIVRDLDTGNTYDYTSIAAGEVKNDEVVRESEASQASEHMLSLLKQGEGKVRFSEIQSSSEATTAVQNRLLEELGLEQIQDLLNRPDMTPEKFADGVYGGWTRLVVREYQSGNNLGVDGVAGTETLASMTGLNFDSTTRLAALPSSSATYASKDSEITNNAV